MLKYLFLALFAVFSAIHLYHSWLDKYHHRTKTKPFLILFLSLYYIFATDSIDIFLVLALCASWLGDILLIPKGNKWFIMGGIAFMISHFFFIVTYIPNIDLSKALWPVAVPLALVYFGISIFIMNFVKEGVPKMMVFPMWFYLLCNSCMNLCALLQFMSYRNAGAAMALIGAALFFASDCCLFVVRYHRRPQLIFKKHFTIMVTYLAGELLIVLGMLSLKG
ncbi:MAG: lysoplasmalogenase [Firmicutes bacterium]|jgi:uncharacterized membrane protein YhhN|nr:lysoplasmalogenase [Bacillota bacterium]